MVEKVLKSLQISGLNAMQAKALEACAAHDDVIIISPTGTGKTLAFLLPLLKRLNPETSGVQAMIIVPARELALQIEQVFRKMSSGHKISCLYGGHSTKIEKQSLSVAPAVVVGTPGRIAWHLERHTIDPASVKTLVLDEFDKSLELGFTEEMSYIIRQLHSLKSRILTSATRMDTVPAFAGLTDPVEVNFVNEKNDPASAKLRLAAIRAGSRNKQDALLALLGEVGEGSTLVFCNHREAVESISALLTEKNIMHGIFHGKMEQQDRERSLIRFRNGSFRVLITTDLASRGLDIPEIENVIHYQLPHTEEVFTHRNGRTARMKAEGKAWLVLGPEEHVPPFIREKIHEESLPVKQKIPSKPRWATLYIGAGKKDKISKMDIVGMLHQKGKLSREELGMVEVLDHSAYAAIAAERITGVLANIRQEKIKNRKIKMEIAR